MNVQEMREFLLCQPDHAEISFSPVEYLRAMNAEKEYLCAAFMAETGLKPSQCMIVEVRNGMELKFYIAKKDSNG